MLLLSVLLRMSMLLFFGLSLLVFTLFFGVALLLALLLVLVPWTAINLIDFYLIHRGHYDLDSIFASDGGIYGRFNNKAIVAYVLGIVVQIPFMNTPLYAGPVAGWLNGADLSWIVGLAVTAPAYYLLARNTTLAPSELTPVPV